MADKPLLVAVSPYGDEAIRGRARWAGFDHFLAKPADPWAVEALLGGYAGLRPPARGAVTSGL